MQHRRWFRRDVRTCLWINWAVILILISQTRTISTSPQFTEHSQPTIEVHDHTMDSENNPETPLLSTTSTTPQYHSLSRKPSSTPSTSSSSTSSHPITRSIEDDVLPETAVLGRNLGWSSAYIIIISRVVGSGIFATPGAIVNSVGSIGLSLLLWVAGAVIAWCGLAASLEYGCMLPRSGGGYFLLDIGWFVLTEMCRRQSLPRVYVSVSTIPGVDAGGGACRCAGVYGE